MLTREGVTGEGTLAVGLDCLGRRPQKQESTNSEEGVK